MFAPSVAVFFIWPAWNIPKAQFLRMSRLGFGATGVPLAWLKTRRNHGWAKGKRRWCPWMWKVHFFTLNVNS